MTIALEAPGGVLRLTLAQPMGTRPVAPKPVDLSVAPGARALLRHAWQGGGTRLELLCVQAEPPTWIDDLAGPTLSGATAVARKMAAMSRATEGAIEHDGLRWTRSFELASAENKALGRHWLGFAGEGAELTLCSAVCSSDNVDVCRAAIASVVVDGDFVAPPRPGVAMRAAAWTSEHPRQATLLVGTTALVLVGLLLWRRPRPRY